MKNFALIALFVALSPLQAFADNKKLVRDFYETAFVKHQPEEAMKLFVGDKYIQHNPHVKNGKEPFIEYFSVFFKKNPKATTDIKRMIAEGDLVAVHAHSKANAKDLGYAAIDIFRIENGKIVEHWDAVQNVPAKSANSNTMF